MNPVPFLRIALSKIRALLIDIFATKYHLLLFTGTVIGIVVSVLMKRPDYTVRALIFIIPAAVVSVLIYWIYRGRIQIEEALFTREVKKETHLIIFSLIFSVSLISLLFAPYRPWYYLLLLVVLYCLIFLQIAGSNPNPFIILSELSCVMGNLIFGLHFKYPLFFGYTDIIPHLYLSKITYLSSHIIPIDLDNTYANFPLFHINVAIGKSILGVDIRIAFILLTSLAFISLIWLVYLLANEIHPNVQLSLLISLVFACTPAVITYSTYVVTRVMAFIGFAYLLFLAQKRMRTSMKAQFSVLIIIISVYIILVHQVSILQIMPLLLLLFALELFVNDLVSMRPDVLALITVTFSAYWVFVSTVMSEIILTKTESIGTAEITQVRSSVQAGNEYIFLWNNIDTTVTVLLVLLGIGYLLWTYRAKYASVLGFFALIMTPLRFPSPLTASSLAMITFRTDRFELLLAPFYAIVIGAGFVSLFHTLNRNAVMRKVAPICCLLVFSFLCASALTGGNSSDCVDIISNESRVYFTDSEMKAFDFITNKVTFGSTITSDLYAGRMFENHLFSGTQALQLPYFNKKDSLSSPENYTFSEGLLIMRNQEFLKNGLRFDSASVDYGDTIYPTEKNIQNFRHMEEESNKVYDNRDVYILTNENSVIRR